jgi:hypothetical protein
MNHLKFDPYSRQPLEVALRALADGSRLAGVTLFRREGAPALQARLEAVQEALHRAVTLGVPQEHPEVWAAVRHIRQIEAHLPHMR